MAFVNREQELALLEELFHSAKAELFIVYGRRRVGKTELLRQFCQSHPHLFFVATQTTERNQLGLWSRLLWQQAHRQELPDFTFPDWEASLKFLATLVQTKPVIVVIDEFPYLVEANSALPSILQKVWDETLRHSQILLILCGSSIGMMERETLDYSSPLYGRRSGQLLLSPLEFGATRQFFPTYTPAEQVEMYAILGGMPAYLTQFDPATPLATNVIRQILSPNRFLYDEPLFLLRTELREPRNYFAVLEAIAHGNTRPNAIAQSSGVGDARTVSKYLSVLQELHLIERHVPVTETQPQKSRLGLYRLSDHFLQFWFRFVAPHRSELDQGQADLVWQNQVELHLATFVGPAFEQICRQHLWQEAHAGHLPFAPTQIGAWWRQQREIDLVAINRETDALLIGECQWRSRPVGRNILDELQQGAKELLAKHPAHHIYYALFAKAGFTPDLRDLADRDPTVLLYDLETL